MKDLAFLWFGQDLPWFNRVALKSFMEVGHSIHLFCEPELKYSASEFPLLDYREILDEKNFWLSAQINAQHPMYFAY